MTIARDQMVCRLRNDIQAMEGAGTVPQQALIRNAPTWLRDHLPHGFFPMGAIHELIPASKEDLAATVGFIGACIFRMMGPQAMICWISQNQIPFASGLFQLGLNPARILFIQPPSEKDCPWIWSEALESGLFTVVAGDLERMDFVQSRRLQLAAGKKGVTGLLIHQLGMPEGFNACVSRWRIRSIPSFGYDDLPGIGLPSWKIDLLRMRHGKPGTWDLSWSGQDFIESGTQKNIPFRSSKIA